MRQMALWIVVIVGSLLTAGVPSLSGLALFWPMAVAFAVILVTREAAAGLGAGVVTGCLVLADGSPVEAVRSALEDHLFPAISSPWHVGALLFTLLLGAFAGVLESSGGFSSLLGTLLARRGDPRRRVLGSVYGLGLLCFFDGLANSMLIGRIARPAADRVGVSREKLAWVVDSTSSPVACVSFISTWIAFQLTLIGDQLPDAEAYRLYFLSIPANPYCLLTLALVPLAIARNWEPGPMKRYRPADPAGAAPERGESSAAWRVLVPLLALAAAILLSLQIWSGNPIDLLSLDTWRTAASGDGTPLALVGGALGGLAVAAACHPARGGGKIASAMLRGASGLLPALVVLILAWSLGSVFEASGAAGKIRLLLGERMAAHWMPIAVFAVTSLTAFATGSSWGTMALLLPISLSALTGSAGDGTAIEFAPGVIGAVFGGAVFGDHCSPFSDTTVVSALASGCGPVDHVLSQLPYALTAATAACFAYLLMALGAGPALATFGGLAAMVAFVVWSGRHGT